MPHSLLRSLRKGDYDRLKGENVMNVIEAIHCRHSYRGKYKNIPVPKDDLIKIMQAGLDAPSGCNKQTTSLIAVDDPHILAKLRRVIDPPIGDTAPAAICVLTQRINAYRDKCFAVQDYSAAIQNMLLQAVDSGLGTCWIGAFDPAQVNQLLGLKDLTCIYLVAVGYPAESPVMLRIHKGDSTKYFLDSEDVLHVPKYQPEDIAEFL